MNHKIKKIHNVVNSNIFIIFIFAFLSIISVFFMRHNIIGFSNDFKFNWSRIFEIKDSIINGQGPFPKIMLNNFLQNGSAVMITYPYINLFPAVLLSFFVKSFSHMLVILFVMRNFLSLIVAFYASLKFCKNNKISFLFSIGYVFSNIVLFYNFTDMDMGITSSLVYLPMVLFGFFDLLDNKNWKEFALGLSAIILCHVITAIIVILLLVVLSVINLKKIKIRLIRLALIKSIITIALTTSFFWFPLICLKINNNILMPEHIVSDWMGTSYNTILLTSFDNQIMECITLIAVLGILVSVINYKNISGYSKQLFWIGIAVILIASSCFPWSILANTLIEVVLQRIARLFIIAQLIFCYLFGENVIKLCKNKRNSIISMVAITFVVMGSQVASQKSVVEQHINNPYYFQPVNNIIQMDGFTYLDYLPSKYTSLKDYLPSLYSKSNNKYTSLRNDIGAHLAATNNQKKIKTHLMSNGKFGFKLTSKVRTLKLPFVIYNNINYEVKVNGKDSNFYSDYQSQLTLNNLSKGEYKVQIIVHKSWYDYVSYVLSLLGVIILLFSWIRSLIIKRKSN